MLHMHSTYTNCTGHLESKCHGGLALYLTEHNEMNESAFVYPVESI